MAHHTYLNRWLEARMALIENPGTSLIVWDERSSASIDRDAFANSFTSGATARPYTEIIAHVNPQTAQALVRRQIVGLVREVRSSSGYLVARVYKLDVVPAEKAPSTTRRFNDATRCTVVVTLKDGSAADCGRKRTVGALCTQHAKMHVKNCWGCGAVLERETDNPIVVLGHVYCGCRCVEVENPDYPTDYDAQDRRAASEERIANLQQER